MVEGKVHHFSAGGLYDGLILLVDDETRTYWNHITGEALHGPLRGARLDTWNLEYTTVEAALATDSALTISRPRGGFLATLMGILHRKQIDTRGFLPPGFRKTMGKEDTRLPTMAQGLGVMLPRTNRFYPVAALKNGPIVDSIADRRLRVALRDSDRVPFATWEDDGTRPPQLFTRWYGFSYTFPGCSIRP